MSVAQEAIDALLAALADERVAIRKLDGAAVERAATEKESCARVLAGLTPADLIEHARELVVLRAELRRNGVLLAHARACLRGARGLDLDGRTSLGIDTTL